MNHWMTGALATCRFELRRSLTFQRTAVSIVLALFPPTMLGLLVLGSILAERAGASEPSAFMSEVSTFVTVLLNALIVLLSLMLWATPNVSNELEGKSWAFIASRPGGRVSMLLGKFLSAVAATFAISTLATTLCVLIIWSSLPTLHPERTWLALMGIFLIASLAYGAIFSLIGVVFFKRAMVIAAGYVIAFEIVLASVPGALINKFTLRYHLQEIGISWLGWFLPATGPSGLQEYRYMYGSQWPVAVHLFLLLALTVVVMLLAVYVIRSREYVTSDPT